MDDEQKENEKIPTESMPGTDKWWTYLSLVVRLVLFAALIYGGIRLLLT